MGNRNQVHWISLMSVNDENRMLKTHGFIDDGEEGNISLCERVVALNDGDFLMSMNELMEEYKSEYNPNGCKRCISIFNRRKKHEFSK